MSLLDYILKFKKCEVTGKLCSKRSRYCTEEQKNICRNFNKKILRGK